MKWTTPKLVSSDILKYHLEKLTAAFVPAEEGKGLSANDFTDADRAKVDALPEKSVNGATITLDETSLTWNGEPQCPEIVSVRVGEETLTEGIDYVNLSTEAIEPGSYSVVILGIGSYGGQASASWEIGKAGAPVTAREHWVKLTGSQQTNFSFTRLGDTELSLDNDAEQVATAQIEGDRIDIHSDANGVATLRIRSTDADHYEGAFTLYVIVGSALSDFSWPDVAKIAASGAAGEVFSVGDEKQIDMGADYSDYPTRIKAQIIGLNHDDLDESDEHYGDPGYNEGSNKAAITFQLNSACKTIRNVWTSKMSGLYSWRDSEIQTLLDGTRFEAIEEPVKSSIRTVAKQIGCAFYDTTPDITTEPEKLFLLSEKEISGSSYISEGSQYEWHSSHDKTEWVRKIPSDEESGFNQNMARTATRTLKNTDREDGVDDVRAMDVDGTFSWMAINQTGSAYNGFAYAPAFCL